MEALDAEVGVVGLGAMGSMAAWQLARRGASVIGWDRFRPGHAFGASAGEARQYRTTYLEPEVADVVARADEAYRLLEHESGETLVRRTGAVTIGPADGALAPGLISRIEAAGDEPRVYDAAEAARRFPRHRFEANDVAVWNPEAGLVRPEHAVVAAQRVAVNAGARLVPNTPVQSIRSDGAGVSVEAGGRAWRVRHVVVTAGAWAWPLLEEHVPGIVPGADLGRLLLTWFPVRGDADFRAPGFPVFTREVAGHRIYGFPSLWDGAVRVGFAGPRERLASPNGFDYVAEPRAEVEEVSAIVAATLPDLVPTPIRTGNFFDGYTPDGQPIVGQIAGGITVAAGFSGRGFKMAPVVGSILADLATSGVTEVTIDAWDPLRFRG